MESCRWSPQWLDAWILCLLVAVSLALFIASESVWYGDAIAYAADIRAGSLIEPGHLLWRPCLKLIEVALHRNSSYSNVLWQLQFACLAASVLAVAALYLVVSSIYGRRAALVLAAFMAVSNGFWTYSFSGCSYSLSLLFMILAVRAAVAERGAGVAPARAFLAGLLGGLSAATWAIQLLAAPAIGLALALTPARDKTSLAAQSKNMTLLAVGYALTFAIPLLVAYLAQTHLGGSGVKEPRGGTADTLGAWLAASRHGIPPHIDTAQLLRAAMGWPQSFFSLRDLGLKLRLWRLQEAGFPASAALVVLVVFYAAVVWVIGVIALAYRRLDAADRGLVVAAAAALIANLMFAAWWQGTDLERYFPSLPLQLLLLGLAIRLTIKRRVLTFLVPATLFLTGVAVWNWHGTFAPVLSPDSLRQTWLRELRRTASGSDLVVVFGQRMSEIISPHDPNMPKIDNVSNEIVMRGAGWRDAEVRNITATLERGGRVFLADSLFGVDTSPRNGWSFREYPTPGPTELRSAFLPYKSDRVAFVAAGERVWLGTN